MAIGHCCPANRIYNTVPVPSVVPGMNMQPKSGGIPPALERNVRASMIILALFSFPYK